MNISNITSELIMYIEDSNLKGYDPYDGLNSSILIALSFGKKILRIACIQLLKKLPVNIRPLLGIKKEYNPKSLGLFLWSYAKLYNIKNNAKHLKSIDSLLDLLEQLKSRNCSGNAWGYNFDWQSRAFFVPKFTPTVVNSSFIGHALIDTYLLTGNEKALQMALPIADFILKDLNRLEEGENICFSYTPIDKYFVHNANLMGASLLIRLHQFSKKDEQRDIALKALNYSMAHQHANGSWFYAEKESAHWIDSFHTGFNLQALKYFLAEGYAREYQAAFERGAEFYANNFFLSDGTPKYYHDQTYPIDIHSPAQALVFFSDLGKQYQDLTWKIFGWTLTHMRDQRGFYYFQKHRYWTNKIPYMRWSQAWMFHALTAMQLNSSKQENKVC